MLAGLQVFNSENVVQIDDNYKNFEFKEKYSVNLDGYFASANFATHNFPNEIVAIGGSTYPLRIESKGGGNYYLSSESPAQTVMVYVFAEPLQSAPNDYGLRLYNSSGEITFDSDRKYMKVIWGGKVPNGEPSKPNPLVVDGLPDRAYACVLSWGRAWWPTNALSALMAVDAVRVKRTSVTVEPLPERFVPGDPNRGFYIMEGGYLTVIDVTGL